MHCAAWRGFQLGGGTICMFCFIEIDKKDKKGEHRV